MSGRRCNNSPGCSAASASWSKAMTLLAEDKGRALGQAIEPADEVRRLAEVSGARRDRGENADLAQRQAVLPGCL